MTSTELFGNMVSGGSEYTRCAHCGYQNCDVRIISCRCSFHARCISIPNTGLNACPSCKASVSNVVLFPMSFRELDEGRKAAATLANNKKRNRKRKGASSSAQDSLFENDIRIPEPGERRSGRWTKEEMIYVDELIAAFERGEFPLENGMKLNDFLSGILKSKQSRLTKKMKNAKLSARSFQRTYGYIFDPEKARNFSMLEESFFHSVQCHQERAEIKFHMQKEWREIFSAYCLSIGQTLDANAWLSSVEEMDRRDNRAKDAARMAKRKLMMGNVVGNGHKNYYNGTSDSPTNGSDTNQVSNVNINNVRNPIMTNQSPYGVLDEPKSGVIGKNIYLENQNGLINKPTVDRKDSSALPFLSRVIQYIQQHNVPFEHVDAWVPSFVPGSSKTTGVNGVASPLCRLCYAGSISATSVVSIDGMTQPLSSKEQYNLKEFADYSEKFSFDVGCGLPGRVYQSGVPTWEQSVQNAPPIHFERSKGANQWGIKTVVGIPVPSPNVGRIVITLYSLFDRIKNQDLVVRLCDELTRLSPCPRWKLVIELGEEIRQEPEVDNNAMERISESRDYQGDEIAPKDSKDSRIHDVVSLLGEYMPSDPSSPLASYIPGFMAMRLMMLKPSWTEIEKELVHTLVASYSSYLATGRSKGEVAVLLARDCMFLVQQQNQPQSNALSPM